MYDIIEKLLKWKEKGIQTAIATVVETWGSAPRKTGSMMAINQLGEFVGSVSGGCVESAVIQESLGIISHQSSSLVEYGVSNQDAWDVGLACGGNIKIFIQYLSDEFLPIFEAVINKNEVSYSTVIGDTDKKQRINIIPTQSVHIGITHDMNNELVFQNTISQPIKIILIGGAQIAQHLSALASSIGLEVIIIDPRKAFSAENRFPDAQIINAWPDEAIQSIGISNNSAVVTLSHDPKIDDPALFSALESNCFYIGALGSRKTHKERIKRLKEMNIDDVQIARIKGPAGLDIGADTPEEIAISIFAEIIEYGHR